ncbi:MAG: hypothetical protein QXQ14_00245 [Candidatus Aenigmatarchaeota archaeon]
MKRDLKFFVKIEKLKKARRKKKIEESELRKILEEIIKEHKVIKSQGLLIKEIKKRTDKALPNIKKIRRILIKLGAKVFYVTRKDDFQENCPVCGNPFSEKYSLNLKGEKIIEYYYCKLCGFKTKDRKDLPIKFKFVFY